MTKKDPRIDVIPTPYFQRDVKQLSKRYRHIQQDLEPVIEQLQKGETPGDQIQGIEQLVYKVRVANRDAGRGKSGGYRLIYYVEIETTIYLLTIYSKSDQADISTNEIIQLIAEIDFNSDSEE